MVSANSHKTRGDKRSTRGTYLGDLVYGANDGIITTFAIISGAIGASLSPGVIIILGVANLIADGFSMGASNFLSIVSKREYQKRIGRRENEDGTPIKHSTATFLAFVIAGSFPLLPFLVPIPADTRFTASIIATALSLFLVGSIRSTVTGRNPFRAGTEMLAVGGIAALLAYSIGYFVKTVFMVSI